MGQTSTGTVRMSAAVAILAVIGLLLSLLAIAAPVAAGQVTGDKVTLCHATNSLQNGGYSEIEISLAGLEAGHKADNGDFHINEKTGLQDFLLGDPEEECEVDEVPDDLSVTPLAPTTGAATCDAAGTLTLTAVEGVSYTIEPAYTAGASGAFAVTASADEGYVIAEGAQTVFNVTVQAKLNCVTALAPSVSAGTCAAPGALTLNAVTGVTYSVSPAYAAGASGSFTVTAAAAAGFTLTGPTVFVVNVPAQLVCEATLGGNPTPTPTPAAPAAPVVRESTLAASVPNTAMDSPMTQLPVVFLALLTLGSLGYLGRRNLVGIRNRR